MCAAGVCAADAEGGNGRAATHASAAQAADSAEASCAAALISGSSVMTTARSRSPVEAEAE